VQQIVPFLWFDGQAEEAATFYASVIPDSSVDHVERLPDGSTMVVAFRLHGQPFRAMNAGPGHPHSDAISFQIDVDGQAELDRIWDAFLDAGATPSMCGWLMSAGGDPAGAARAFEAMRQMVKLDIDELQAAIRG
jgi:predicted 3-demethylubiquinone-9 3-methyltransferase (glyoxalase superfamily)